MKGYINQIFEEGLGSTIFKPIKGQIDKHTKGNINKILTSILKFVYIILAILIAFCLFYVAYPFN